jgi:putative ABC transport system permease protein
MSEVMNNSLWAPRMGAMLLTLLGLLSLALAAIGIYGVTRYSVSQRQRDISIRMAIGARGSDVVYLFVTRIMWRVLAGMALGLGGAFLAGRTLSSLFYGVGVTDLGSFATTGLLLILAAMAASYLPARRATRIDPIAALRSE